MNNNFKEWYDENYPEENFDSQSERDEHRRIVYSGWTAAKNNNTSAQNLYAIVRWIDNDFDSILLETGNGEMILDMNSGEYWNFVDNKWGFRRNEQ